MKETAPGVVDGPLFIADSMLARLARWLRVLGFDTAFDPSADDHDLVGLASDEERILLTRDRHLVEHLRPPRVVLITADAPLVQLKQVIDACGLTLANELFTRCLLCNTELRGATETEIEELVPDHARATAGRFRSCPGCGRVYWAGSHARRMMSALERAFPERFTWE